MFFISVIRERNGFMASHQKYLAFLRTVELGNITRAAEELGYTQSAVSRMIADLEQEWNLCLLTRGRQGVVLSTDGAHLLPYIRAVCNAQRELDGQVDALHGLTRGVIRIGTFPSVAVQWLPSIMKSFLTLYPGVQFQLVSSIEYSDTETLVAQGQVDCGFVALPLTLNHTPPLHTISLFHDRLLAVLPTDHPMADRPTFPMEQFLAEPFIRLTEDRDKELAVIFDRTGIHPAAQYSVDNDYAIISMVEAGLGVSLLTELVLQRTPYQVVTKPLDPPQTREIGLVLRSPASASPATARFVEHVRRCAGVPSGPDVVDFHD